MADLRAGSGGQGSQGGGGRWQQWRAVAAVAGCIVPPGCIVQRAGTKRQLAFARPEAVQRSPWPKQVPAVLGARAPAGRAARPTRAFGPPDPGFSPAFGHPGLRCRPPQPPWRRSRVLCASRSLGEPPQPPGSFPHCAVWAILRPGPAYTVTVASAAELPPGARCGAPPAAAGIVRV